MEEHKNIIIFDDFSVFSSYPKGITKEWLRQSARFLATYTQPFPVCPNERILIAITENKSPISSVFISSPMEVDDTVDTIETVIDLLESNGVDFFCPDESF